MFFCVFESVRVRRGGLSGGPASRSEAYDHGCPVRHPAARHQAHEGFILGTNTYILTHIVRKVGGFSRAS